MLLNDRLTEPRAASADETIVTDIVIVGGGLAGSLAAAVLARAGHRVILIDKRAVYPEEFRVEKLAGQQLDILRRLGFIRELEAVACSYDHVLNIREGKVVDVSIGQAYGLSYDRLVAMARGLIPDPCSFIVDQVTGVSCSGDLQHSLSRIGKAHQFASHCSGDGHGGRPWSYPRNDASRPCRASFRFVRIYDCPHR